VIKFGQHSTKITLVYFLAGFEQQGQFLVVTVQLYAGRCSVHMLFLLQWL